MKRKKKGGRVTRGVVATAAAAGLLLSSAQAAEAYTVRTVQTLAGSGHILMGRGYWQRGPAADLVSWKDFRTSEAMSGDPRDGLDTICAYQGFLAEINPAGTTVWTQYSTYRPGCNLYLGFFDWGNWNANYKKGTKFQHKWKSDQTGNAFKSIGKLTGG